MNKFKIIKNPEWTKEEQDNFAGVVKDNNNFCPCSIIKDKDHKCMCLSFRKQNYEGECHCGLYYKVEI